MKGTILVCLRDMLAERYEQTSGQWRSMLEAVGLGPTLIVMPTTDIPDAQALALFGVAQEQYFPSHEALADAFGHYWCTQYAPAVYGSIYRRFSSARDFILGMDKVHVQVTESISNARPPRFSYVEQGDGSLLVSYQSQRGLIHIFAGLCRGIGAYFQERLEVKVISDEELAIRFLGA